jgi:hypothetical protein
VTPLPCVFIRQKRIDKTTAKLQFERSLLQTPSKIRFARCAREAFLHLNMENIAKKKNRPCGRRFVFFKAFLKHTLFVD